MTRRVYCEVYAIYVEGEVSEWKCGMFEGMFESLWFLVGSSIRISFGLLLTVIPAKESFLYGFPIIIIIIIIIRRIPYLCCCTSYEL